VQSGWAELLNYLATFSWGAAIAISYRSQIAERFETG
jgi:hypothetical protein